MDVKEAGTKELEGILRNIKSQKELNKYIDDYTKNNFSCFAEYFNSYVSYKGLKLSEIIGRSNVSKNYVYNIVNGDRNPGRDKIIALCIGAGMSYEEINRGLKIAKQGVLYPKDERDARIITAVNNGIKNVLEINIILESENLPLLE